jgi:hypothetical protein
MFKKNQYNYYYLEKNIALLKIIRNTVHWFCKNYKHFVICNIQCFFF